MSVAYKTALKLNYTGVALTLSDLRRLTHNITHQFCVSGTKHEYSRTNIRLINTNKDKMTQ